MVEGNYYVSFQDDCEYDIKSMKDSRVRTYDHEDVSKMVSKGRKKLRNKRKTSQEYDKALEKAVEYIKSHLNPNFQLDLEANGCVDSTSSRSKQTSASENVPCDLPHQQQYPLNGKKRDRQGNILGLKNGGSVDDVSWWDESCYEDKILHGNKRRQKKPGSSSSLRMASTSPLQSKSERKRGRKKKSPPTSEFTSPNASVGIEDAACSQSPCQVQSPEDTTDKTPPPTQPSHQLPITPTIALSTPALTASTPIEITSGCATVPTSSSHVAAASCPIDVDSEDDCRITGTDSDSDDDLPAIDLSIKESVSLYELKPGSVVWAKYHKWPFWPALVSKVPRHGKRRKSLLTKSKNNVVDVYFFGYNDSKPSKISSKTRIAPFGTKNSVEYIKQAKEYNKEMVQFHQAVKEARDLVRDMADGLYKDIHSPRQIYQKATSNRPMDYNSTLPYNLNLSETEDSEGDEETEQEIKQEGEQSSILCLSEGCSSDEDNLEEEEEQSEKGLYSYDQVQADIRSLHPLLEDIARGVESSEFHSIFVSGSRKQQSGLKYSDKYGPILKGWNDKMKARLMDEELLVVAKKVGFDFTYVYDVLLPEAMVRLIARNDNISYSDALEKFYSC